MDSKEYLKQVVNALVQGDEAAAKEAHHHYVEQKSKDLLNVIEAKFDSSNMDYIKQNVPVKNSATAKLPNAFVNQHLDPVVYRNGNSVNDEIGLDFSSHDYTDDTSAKDGTPTKKKKKKES